MPILLFRVDERLIHGQVTVGWGSRLHPERYLVVDDPLADSEWEQEIHRLGVPLECSSEFLTVEEARERLPELLRGGVRTVLLTRDLDHMLRLARGGAMTGESVNLGGVHHAHGRHEILPYLFLDDEDRDRIEALVREGVIVTAQDLPGAPKTRFEELRGGG